ncbi:maleylpyruvate isomerase family mycothiol-dependent enzyme [Arthrobacter polaris]|uniref:maleylpyruvate isomerase family mycothiol-dependent enzyme n=1 Tax=Arthrobacter polaris TaxID=2813727 RepID=UPI001F21599D|nr:maleylpyruvate isomerase family mycothiol-dependent enzyme [Arthrobacter polaris]UIK89925.1 maleylpyruvate isomerase family mycothiol-dependent enzyme [Arthrobacter polaris]
MSKSSDGQLWALAHAERGLLAEDLKDLSPQQWRHGTLCDAWDVEEVLAHLSAAASLNQRQWMRSMLGARFRPAVHNQRRLEEHRGATPAETLDLFRAVINSSIAPSSHTPAYLGEVVVHSQDIRQPLGLPRTPNISALTSVAEFYARRNFAVASHTRAQGLRLEADDGAFVAGTGPLVTGSTLALVMTMAGRVTYLKNLDGPGVRILQSRLGNRTR